MASGFRFGPARLLHNAFELGLLFKGIFAVFETVSGLALAFVANQTILDLVHWLTAHEVTEDPNDLLAQFFMRIATGFSIETQDFYAYYLLGHGLVKIVVVLLLVRGLRGAYPFAMAALAGFVIYQVHRYLLEPDLGLILLSLLDIVLIVLTYIEYRALGRRAAP